MGRQLVLAIGCLAAAGTLAVPWVSVRPTWSGLLFLESHSSPLMVPWLSMEDFMVVHWPLVGLQLGILAMVCAAAWFLVGPGVPGAR